MIFASRSQDTFVEIGDMKISKSSNCLITLALGSCIGVCAYDSIARVGALLHLMLPEARANPENAKKRPFAYADTGINKMIENLLKEGARKNRLQISLAGGANIMDPNSLFDIGKRNFLAAKKQLWKHNIIVKSTSVGGERGRSLKLDMADGGVYVKFNSESKYFRI